MSISISLSGLLFRRFGAFSDHGNQRRTNGVANVDLEEETEQRDKNDPAAQASERSEQTGSKRPHRDQNGEFENIHRTPKESRSGELEVYRGVHRRCVGLKQPRTGSA